MGRNTNKNTKVAAETVIGGANTMNLVKQKQGTTQNEQKQPVKADQATAHPQSGNKQFFEQQKNQVEARGKQMNAQPQRGDSRPQSGKQINVQPQNNKQSGLQNAQQKAQPQKCDSRPQSGKQMNVQPQQSGLQNAQQKAQPQKCDSGPQSGKQMNVQSGLQNAQQKAQPQKCDSRPQSGKQMNVQPQSNKQCGKQIDQHSRKWDSRQMNVQESGKHFDQKGLMKEQHVEHSRSSSPGSDARHNNASWQELDSLDETACSSSAHRRSHRNDQFISNVHRRLDMTCRQLCTPYHIDTCMTVQVSRKLQVTPDLRLLDSSDHSTICIIQTPHANHVRESDIENTGRIGSILKSRVNILVVEPSSSIPHELDRLARDCNVRIMPFGDSLSHDFADLLKESSQRLVDSEDNYPNRQHIGKIYVTKDGLLDGSHDSTRQFIKKFGDIAFVNNRKWDTSRDSVKHLMRLLEEQGELRHFARFCR